MFLFFVRWAFHPASSSQLPASSSRLPACFALFPVYFILYKLELNCRVEWRVEQSRTGWSTTGRWEGKLERGWCSLSFTSNAQIVNSGQSPIPSTETHVIEPMCVNQGTPNLPRGFSKLLLLLTPFIGILLPLTYLKH